MRHRVMFTGKEASALCMLACEYDDSKGSPDPEEVAEIVSELETPHAKQVAEMLANPASHAGSPLRGTAEHLRRWARGRKFLHAPRKA